MTVTDLRSKPIEQLTDQQISSRLHIIADDKIRLRKALAENEKMFSALLHEQQARLLKSRQS